MRNIILMLVITLLVACKSKKTADTEKEAPAATGNIVTITDAQKRNAGIQTGKPEQKEISSLLKLSGKIDVPPQNIVSVSVPLGGYLKSTQLLPGMHIAKGEIIAIVEDQQYIQLQQDYLTARSKLSFIEHEYTRQRELNKDKAASDKVYQLAEADYNSQKVLINALAERLKLVGINPAKLQDNNISRTINIYSPIDGYVSRVNVNIGKYVSPTEVLFELINPTDIHLALKVFEKDLDKLFIGQKVIAYTNNEPDKKYNCEILLIARDLSADRAAEVHCHFEVYDKKLLPGMYMNAQVQVTNKRAWALPEASVVRFENRQYVFAMVNERQYEMVEVQAGDTKDGYIEIKDGDKLADKTIVIKNAYTLLMALKNKGEEE